MNNCYVVYRNDGIVKVAIMISEQDNKYHFVNLTKEHICPCAFDTVEDALKDLEDYQQKGKIISFEKIKLNI